MSLKLREFIKKIRACKTIEEERSVCNKESSKIRNLKKVNKKKKKNKFNRTKQNIIQYVHYQNVWQ